MSALEVQVGGSHYKTFLYQPVEFAVDMELPYIPGCVVKYMSRWRHKNGVEDLRKVQHFMDLSRALHKMAGPFSLQIPVGDRRYSLVTLFLRQLDAPSALFLKRYLYGDVAGAYKYLEEMIQKEDLDAVAAN